MQTMKRLLKHSSFMSYLKMIFCTVTKMIEHLWVSHSSRGGKGDGKMGSTLKVLTFS